MSEVIDIEVIPVAIVDEPVVEPTVSVMIQRADFMEDCVCVTLGEGAAEIKKMISFEDFHTILSGAISKRTQMATNPFLLPTNCFYFAVSGTEVKLSVYYPEETKEMRYGTRKFQARIPNVIVSHILAKGRGENNWQVAGTKYFCTDRTVGQLPKTFIHGVNNQQRCWLFPFTNTYPEGHMCYGNNVMPASHEKGNLRGLDWYYQFLFQAPFNDDLGVNAISRSISPGAWYDILAGCAREKTGFPYERLTGFTPVT